MTTSTPRKTTPTAAKLDQLRKAYLVVFHGFSASRSEVAIALGVSNAVASKLLNTLRESGLIDSVDVNDESQGSSRRGAFQEVEWQCAETYDSIKEPRALELFEEAFDLVPEPPVEPVKPRSTKLSAKDIAALEPPAPVGTPVDVWAPAFTEHLATVTPENSQTMFAKSTWCRLCEQHNVTDRKAHAARHNDELAAWRKAQGKSAPAKNGGPREQVSRDLAAETVARIIREIEGTDETPAKGITAVAKALTADGVLTASGKTTWHAAVVRSIYLKASGKSHLPSKMAS